MWLYPAMFRHPRWFQGCVLTICAMLLGHWLRILDFPDHERKLHERVTPRTGGVAVCLALVLGVLEWTWMSYLEPVPVAPGVQEMPLIPNDTVLTHAFPDDFDRAVVRSGIVR